MAIELGRTPWGAFGPGEIIENESLEVDTIICDLWKAFPESAAWDQTAKRFDEDGCICLDDMAKTTLTILVQHVDLVGWKTSCGGGHWEPLYCVQALRVLVCFTRYFKSLSDEDSEERSHVMTSLDTNLWAHTSKSYGMPYVCMLLGMSI